jgi:transposase-like protein
MPASTDAIIKTLNIRLKMLEGGGLSVAAFARKYGYKPNTVRRVIYRYSQDGKTPRKRLSREIVANIEKEIASQL